MTYPYTDRDIARARDRASHVRYEDGKCTHGRDYCAVCAQALADYLAESPTFTTDDQEDEHP